MAYNSKYSTNWPSAIDAGWTNPDVFLGAFGGPMQWNSAGNVSPAGSNTVAGIMSRNGESYANDQQATFTIGQLDELSPAEILSVFLRYSTSGGANGYQFEVAGNSGGNRYNLTRWTADSGTSLASGGTSGVFTPGVKVRGRTVGTALEMETDEGGSFASVLSTTDSAHTSGTVALVAYNQAYVDSVWYSDFDAGDITTDDLLMGQVCY